MPRRAWMIPVLSVFLLATACSGDADAPAEAGNDGVERAAYLTLMGQDTLAVEWFEFGDGYVEAHALIRGSRTTFGDYRMETAPTGEVTGLRGAVHAGGWRQGEALQTLELTEGEAGLQLVMSRGGEESAADYVPAPGAVPFIDMLHWPFEAAFRWQSASGGLTDGVATFTGRGMRFGLEANDDGTWALIHPSRGPSTVTLDDAGRILALDGRGSTRAYDLKRVGHDDLDPDAFAAAFADRPLGALSGRGEIDVEVAGAHFTGDYGTPQRRGREIFGNLVAYGVRWRTGANRATHFSFDRDIVVDGQTVPAGEYTLYTIPEADGGLLIISRQTGQTGTRYDEANDQARITMRRDALDEKVEVFEIRVVEADGGGRIELRWDDTVYWVPFTV